MSVACKLRIGRKQILMAPDTIAELLSRGYVQTVEDKLGYFVLSTDKTPEELWKYLKQKDRDYYI